MPSDPLGRWLYAATDHLTASARQRIETEIKAHYADDVEEHLSRGLCEIEAQTAALTSLGDAKVAERRFRRSHLTEQDARFIQGSLDCARHWHWPLLNCLFWSFAIETAFFAGYPNNGLHPFVRAATALFGIGLLWCLSFLRFVAARRLPDKSMWRFAFFSRFCDFLGPMIQLPLLRVNRLSTTALLVGSAIIMFQLCRFWAKYRRGDIWQDMPPKETA